MLSQKHFDQPPIQLAQYLLGKVIRVKYQKQWLSALIIETEAYELNDKASHASLGWTKKRQALFMPPGTIYMYYARGGDSLNISARGDGNAVLIKSAYPYLEEKSPNRPPITPPLTMMKSLNPIKGSLKTRETHRLCAGQTLLCRSLGLKVGDWDGKCFEKSRFYIEDVGILPKSVLITTRLGIPEGRDEHLPYRFVFEDYAPFCTENPLTKRKPNFQRIITNYDRAGAP